MAIVLSELVELAPPFAEQVDAGAPAIGCVCPYDQVVTELNATDAVVTDLLAYDTPCIC